MLTAEPAGAMRPNHIIEELSGARELNRESRANRERSRRCERGRNPVKPLSRIGRDGKVRKVERSVSQKTCLMQLSSIGTWKCR